MGGEVTYAANTDVSVEKSHAELERTLERYGATAFGYTTKDGLVTIAFEMCGRRVAFELSLPSKNDREFTHHSHGARTQPAALAAWEQACRQRWRALNLVVKAKLEAVEAGITTFEDEFLAYICLPGGGTMGDMARPHGSRRHTPPARCPHSWLAADGLLWRARHGADDDRRPAGAHRRRGAARHGDRV